LWNFFYKEKGLKNRVFPEKKFTTFERLKNLEKKHCVDFPPKKNMSFGTNVFHGAFSATF